MSTPEQVAELYKKYLKRKSEIKEIKRDLSDELKSYEDQLEQYTLDLGQVDLFSPDQGR